MAATTTKATKRKSTDSTEQMLKKIKVAKSADRPLPVKSALKKADDLDAVPSSTKSKAKKSSKDGTTANGAKEGKTTTKAAVSKTKVADTKTSSKPKSTDTEPEPAKAKEEYTESNTKKSGKKDAPKPASNGVKKSKPSKEDELVESDNEEEDGAALSSDQTAALIAGFSSSEDEDEDEGIPIAKLPKAPIDKALAEKAAEAAGALATIDHDDPESTPGIIYIGRLPHGFYEHQMRAYFTQFGKITHLRLARSRKTAKSQHYAFIEFASGAVADIVAKTMDKYLLFNHILQVRRVPSEQVKDTIWKGEGRRKRAMPMNRIEGTKLRKGTTAAGWEKRIGRENSRRQAKAEKLKELDYEFEAPIVKGIGEGTEYAIEAQTAETQLLEETKDAAEHADDTAKQIKHASNSGKKRSAVAAVSEGRKTKKTKAKA